MDRHRSEHQLPDHDPDSSQQPDRAADAPGSQDDAPQEGERRRHDQTYKGLFAHGAAIESLIRDFLAVEWHEHLDLDTAALVSTETVSKGLKRRLADFAVRVWFKGGEASVVFLVEFQASHDSDMALRTLDYAIGMVEALRANPKMLDPGDAVPLLLSCVLHTGPKRWPAETSLAALTRTPEPPPAVARAVAGFGTAHRCVVLDLQSASARGLLPTDSLLGWLGALERAPLGDALPRVHASLARQWAGAERASFRRSFAKWTDERGRWVPSSCSRWATPCWNARRGTTCWPRRPTALPPPASSSARLRRRRLSARQLQPDDRGHVGGRVGPGCEEVAVGA